MDVVDVWEDVAEVAADGTGGVAVGEVAGFGAGDGVVVGRCDFDDLVAAAEELAGPGDVVNGAGEVGTVAERVRRVRWGAGGAGSGVAVLRGRRGRRRDVRIVAVAVIAVTVVAVGGIAARADGNGACESVVD
jgi:hypothetical protein